jgi:hypothetical protein
MREHSGYLGVACLVLAGCALAWGIATEFRQTREDGPVATVPTLPFGVMASLLLTFGLGFLRVELPWWGYFLLFPGGAVLFCVLIYQARRRSPRT